MLVHFPAGSLYSFQLLLPVCCLPCLLALAHSLFAERAFQRHISQDEPPNDGSS